MLLTCVMFTGIHKHAIGVLGWVSLLTYVQNKRDAYLAEKDAVLRHYVELHKEDFTIPGISLFFLNNMYN